MMTGAPAANVEVEQSSRSSRSEEQHHQGPFDPSPIPSLESDRIRVDDFAPGDGGNHARKTRGPFLRPNLTTGTTPTGTTSHHQQQHQHQQHHQSMLHTHTLGWDIPPLVASPYSGPLSSPLALSSQKMTTYPKSGPLWKARKCRPVTPQHMASILLLMDASPPEQTMDTGRAVDVAGNPAETHHVTLLNDQDYEEIDNGGDDLETNHHLGEPRDATMKLKETAASSINLASTACCSCPPLLWKEEFLIVALANGEIRAYGNLLGILESQVEVQVTMESTLGYEHKSCSSHTTMATNALNPPIIQSPLASLILPSDSCFIVQLLPMPLHLAKDSFLALTVEGHVYQFRFVKATDTNENASRQDYSLELDHSWKTGSMGATCMVFAGVPSLTLLSQHSKTTTTTTTTTTPAASHGGASSPKSSPATSRQQPQGEALLLVGYTSGHIECWKILATTSLSQSPSKVLSALPQRTLMTPRTRRRPHCIWKGLVDEPYSVLSMQVLLSTAKNINDDAVVGQCKEYSNTEKTLLGWDEPSLLITTLQAPIGEEPPVLQAFDLTAIYVRATTDMGQSTRQTSREDVPTVLLPSDNLPLTPFRVLSDPAMGLIELTFSTSTSSTSSRTTNVLLLPDDDDNSSNHKHHKPYQLSHKRNSLFIPSRGANRSLPLQGGHKCGVSLANGTVAILSPGWGISNDCDQLLLSYPAIGMGRISGYLGKKKDQEYLVCCLRAGTCYLIPMSSPPTSSGGDGCHDDEVVVILYPHDLDADSTNVYIQEFTAGCLRKTTTTTAAATTSDKKDEEDSPVVVPVLVYVCPGGVIEIYSCELLTGSQRPNTICNDTVLPTMEEQVLQEMIRQGCLEMCLQVLERIDHDEGLSKTLMMGQQQNLWDNARLEVRAMQQQQQPPQKPNDQGEEEDEASEVEVEQQQQYEPPLSLVALKAMPALRRLLLHLASSAQDVDDSRERSESEAHH